jgi:hypothetical protein
MPSTDSGYIDLYSTGTLPSNIVASDGSDIKNFCRLGFKATIADQDDVSGPDDKVVNFCVLLRTADDIKNTYPTGTVITA